MDRSDLSVDGGPSNGEKIYKYLRLKNVTSDKIDQVEADEVLKRSCPRSENAEIEVSLIDIIMLS